MQNEGTSYWENAGKYQSLYNRLHKLIPLTGSVKDISSNKALEKLRLASNCYYDLYNNGLCNMASEFRKVFGMVGTKILKEPFPNIELEKKLDTMIIEASLEQKILVVDK